MAGESLRGWIRFKRKNELLVALLDLIENLSELLEKILVLVDRPDLIPVKTVCEVPRAAHEAGPGHAIQSEPSYRPRHYEPPE